MSGSNERANQGNYGTLGIPDESNLPPSREIPFHWIDLNGNFWMFGGCRTSNAKNIHIMNSSY
jgi:hypothetical protein